MSDDPIYFAHTEHPVEQATHEPLSDHTVAVANHCMANTPSDTTLSDGTPTQPVLFVMAWCHDLGKLTTWWQEDHGNTTVPSVDRPPGSVGTHSHFGGIATWWVLRELGYPTRVAFAASIAVSRHHGTLPTLGEYSLDKFTNTDRLKTVGHQVDNIHTHDESREIATQLFEYLSRNTGLEKDGGNANGISWAEFVEAIEGGIHSKIRHAISNLTGTSLKLSYESVEMYHDLLELWGGLKGGDTPASAGISPANQTLPTPSVIDRYVDTVLSPPTTAETPVDLLNQKREEIRQSTIDRVDSLIGTQTGEANKAPPQSTERTTTGGNYQLDSFVTTPNPDSDSDSDVDTDDPFPGVYQVTLPTGAGKTLTVTQAALKVCAEQPSSGPLIHILPYTSIIEQTEQVYRKLFDSSSEFNTATDSLDTTVSIGVDHYLADNTPEADDDESDDEGTNTSTSKGNLTEMVYQSWHTDITLSTTVQLWESLYGPSKSQATKLPQFYNSTIIIDEPQTTPPTWWSRVEQLIETLYEVFDATVILMSATHPPLEYPTPTSGVVDTTELAPTDDVSLPANVTVTVDQSVLDDRPLKPTSAAQRLRDEIDAGTDSVLSIHNTVSNARATTESLIARVEADPELTYANIHTVYQNLIGAEYDLPRDDNPLPTDLGRETIYDHLPTVDKLAEALLSVDTDVLIMPLTTRNRPCDRSRILDGLSALLEHYPRDTSEHDDLPTIIAVTTQLIEAGVDISFESLYRDIAPYDSIVQAAGRCNRDYEYGIGNGKVTVWKLDGRDGGRSDRIPAEYVYNQSGINELNKTTQALTNHVTADNRQIEQEQFIESYTAYRDAVASEVPHRTPIMDAVDGETMSKASLIDDDRPEITVYVSQTPTEDALMDAYRKAERRNQVSRKIEIRECLRHIGCSVPRDRDSNPITDVAHQLDTDLYLLDRHTADATDLYSWKGLSNDRSDSVSHRFL